MSRLLRLVAAAALLLTLAGCGAAAVAGTPTAAGAAPAAEQAPAVGGLRIPSIGVDVAAMIPLGLDKDRQPEVPSEDRPQDVGWYVLGPAPGEPGAAVIMAHVNVKPRPGAFARLHELQVGARIEVDHNGRPMTFEVYERGQYDKNAFPAALVYGPTAGPELRLVTCGGDLETTPDGRHSYGDNIIISARRV